MIPMLKRGPWSRIHLAALMSAVLLALLAVTSTRPALAEPAGCAGPEGYGPWRQTQANFSQRVGLNTCADRYQLGARVEFSPTPAFNRHNVRGCMAHFGLVSESNSWTFSEITRDCTSAAQLGLLRSMNTATVWNLPRSPAYLGVRFHVTAYINIQANSYYGTYPYASRWSFSHCLISC
jgi:hypothetical protein